MLQDINRYDDSIKTFESALQIRPASNDAYTNVGYAYECLKRYPEALKFYNMALKICPNSSAALNNKKNLETYLKAKKYAWTDYEIIK